GSLNALLPSARDLAGRFFSAEALPPLKRIALGATLVHSAASNDDALMLLAAFLPAVVVTPGTEDLRYRINRPRLSRVTDGLKLNRLAEWSVGRTTVLQIGPSGEEPSVSAPICLLELDINTAAERTDSFRREDAGLLIGEMSEVAIEIAEKGDIE